jgi:hypothetical protein
MHDVGDDLGKRLPFRLSEPEAGTLDVGSKRDDAVSVGIAVPEQAFQSVLDARAGLRRIARADRDVDRGIGAARGTARGSPSRRIRWLL